MRSHVLHLADLHLGDSHAWLGSGAKARQEEADLLFRRITDHVLARGSRVGGVLLAGDLFDAHDPPAALVESVLDDLERLRRAGVRTLTVPGNHDEYSYPACVYRVYGARWPDRLVTNPAVAKVDTWVLEGVAVDLYAMAFTAGRSRGPFDEFVVEEGAERGAARGLARDVDLTLEERSARDLAREVDLTIEQRTARVGGGDQRALRKIAVIHGSLDVPWTDRSIPLRSSALATRGLDYVALGHVHRPLERRLGKTWVCYPGRIEGGGFGDPGGAGLVTIDLADAAAELRPRREPFPSRPIATERWSVSGMASIEDLETRLERSADPERILRLSLEGPAGFAIDAEVIRRSWAGRFRHLDIVASGGELPELDEIARERTVRGIFATIARERIEEARREASDGVASSQVDERVASGEVDERVAPGEAAARVASGEADEQVAPGEADERVLMCEAALRHGLAAFAAARRETK